MSIVWCHERNTSEDLDLDVAPGRQKLEIVRKFQILTNDIDDGPITVCACNDLPTPFSIYEKGNDRNENTVATTCRATRDKKQPKLWEVTVGYTTAVDFDLAGGTSGSLDMTCFLPSARCWKIPLERTVFKARSQLPALGGGAAETYADAMAKSKVPVANSCNKYFADGITGEQSARAWEIRRYEWYFNETQADAYTNRVNSDTVWGHDPGTVKMVAIVGDLQSVNNCLVWLVTYEFHICDEGWGVPLADNGMEIWAKADGTKPGSPGTATGNAAILDNRGTPISSPVFLDGLGYVGGVSDQLGPSGTPVIVTWHHLEQAAFGSIYPTLPTMQSLNILQVA